MIVGGKYQKFISIGLVLVFGLVIVLPFQNCGLEPTASNKGANTYTGDEDDETPDCLAIAVDCGPSATYLQVSVDMKNPLQLAAGTNQITVSGRCNTGNFAEHYMGWSLVDSQGNDRGSRNDSSICVRGKYQFTVDITGIANATVHTIRVEMVGLLDGQVIRNYQSGGSAESDFSRKAP